MQITLINTDMCFYLLFSEICGISVKKLNSADSAVKQDLAFDKLIV